MFLKIPVSSLLLHFKYEQELMLFDLSFQRFSSNFITLITTLIALLEEEHHQLNLNLRLQQQHQEDILSLPSSLQHFPTH
jgi:hypothetical protein